eukprot:scaffold34204_cov39-Attheya_sp.AAC.5
MLPMCGKRHLHQHLVTYLSTRSDYAEKFGFESDGQLQSEYYHNNQTLSMEGCCLDHFLPTENVLNHVENGGEYVSSPEDTNISCFDTPGHGKDVVDGFNAVQKRILQTCLRKTSMPEVHDNVNSSDPMNIHSMTEKGEEFCC